MGNLRSCSQRKGPQDLRSRCRPSCKDGVWGPAYMAGGKVVVELKNTQSYVGECCPTITCLLVRIKEKGGQWDNVGL